MDGLVTQYYGGQKTAKVIPPKLIKLASLLKKKLNQLFNALRIRRGNVVTLIIVWLPEKLLLMVNTSIQSIGLLVGNGSHYLQRKRALRCPRFEKQKFNKVMKQN